MREETRKLSSIGKNANASSGHQQVFLMGSTAMSSSVPDTFRKELLGNTSQPLSYDRFYESGI